MDADGSQRFRSGPFGRDVVQAPDGASGLSHDETRCAAFAGAGASSASATCRFRKSIPHPVQPLSTLRTPRRRDARRTRSRPACSALNGPDFHWQAHSSFPLAPRVRLSDKTSRRLLRATPSAASEHHLELIGCPISMSFATSRVCLELRPLPSAGVTRFPRYYGPLRHPMSAWPVPHGRPVGPVIPDLTTLWGFPCCARFPCVRAAASTPVQRLGVVFAHLTQSYQPSPKLQSGRPAHRPFRGLLGVSR